MIALGLCDFDRGRRHVPPMAFFLRDRSGPSAVPLGQRVYAIGDLHEHLDLLMDMLALTEAQSAASELSEVLVLLLDDLTDRGPNSASLVRRAMRPLREVK